MWSHVMIRIRKKSDDSFLFLFLFLLYWTNPKANTEL